MHDKLESLLTAAEAAELLRVNVCTLASWRKRGCGPRFVRSGRRHSRVFYRRSALTAWLTEHEHPREVEAREA